MRGSTHASRCSTNNTVCAPPVDMENIQLPCASFAAVIGSLFDTTITLCLSVSSLGSFSGRSCSALACARREQQRAHSASRTTTPAGTRRTHLPELALQLLDRREDLLLLHRQLLRSRGVASARGQLAQAADAQPARRRRRMQEALLLARASPNAAISGEVSGKEAGRQNMAGKNAARGGRGTHPLMSMEGCLCAAEGVRSSALSPCISPPLLRNPRRWRCSSAASPKRYRSALLGSLAWGAKPMNARRSL